MSKATLNEAQTRNFGGLIAETASHEFGGLHGLKVLTGSRKYHAGAEAAITKNVNYYRRKNISFT
jgi:hypothetical protein